MTETPPHPAVLRFAGIIAFLRATVFAYGGRSPLEGILTIRLHRRLGKISLRFAALVAHLARFGADAPRRAYHRKQPPLAAPPQPPLPIAAAGPVAAGPATARVPPARLPHRRGWLAALNLDVRASGAQLLSLVQEPEVLALLAASPRLAALLRPLWWMLGLPVPDALKPLMTKPRAPRRPRKRRWHPPRRADLLFLLRMGKPIEGT